MHTIDDYLDAAINNSKLRSDRALSFALGLGPSAVSQFRTKRSWPSDAVMIKIADLANEDKTEALLSLNIWRNSDTAAAPLYSRLMDKLKAAAMLCIAMAFITASIATLPGHETGDIVASGGMHYILCQILIMLFLQAGLLIPVSKQGFTFIPYSNGTHA